MKRPASNQNWSRQRGIHTRAAIQAYIQRHNQNAKPFVWTAKDEDIIAKYRRAKAVLDKPQTA
jgi:hypothetical protein